MVSFSLSCARARLAGQIIPSANPAAAILRILFIAQRFRRMKVCGAVRGKVAEQQSGGAGYYECEQHRKPRYGNGNPAHLGKETDQEIDGERNCNSDRDTDERSGAAD